MLETILEASILFVQRAEHPMGCPSTQEVIFLNSMVEKRFHVSETALDEERNISGSQLINASRLKENTKLLYCFLNNPCSVGSVPRVCSFISETVIFHVKNLNQLPSVRQLAND